MWSFSLVQFQIESIQLYKKVNSMTAFLKESSGNLFYNFYIADFFPLNSHMEVFFKSWKMYILLLKILERSLEITSEGGHLLQNEIFQYFKNTSFCKDLLMAASVMNLVHRCTFFSGFSKV